MVVDTESLIEGLFHRAFTRLVFPVPDGANNVQMPSVHNINSY